MSDSLPPRPAPIPPPDQHQIERLNATFNLTAFSPESNWRRRLVRHVDFFLSRLLFRQREFNAAVVDHLNRPLGRDSKRTMPAVGPSSGRNRESKARWTNCDATSNH